MSARYAIYFAPDRLSAWWRFGAHWLGRDESSNTALQPPTLAQIGADELTRITEEPRRYGFHATLKAPFRLLPGHDESGLVSRLGQLAQTLSPVALGPMQVTAPGDFVALTPLATSPALQALADACVTGLDDLRAPLTPAELARRRADTLAPREAELLARYGYPYVLEKFRLHLTLTGPVTPDTAQRVMAAVGPEADRLNRDAPLVLDRLCLFVEKSPGTPLLRVIDMRLRA